MLFPRIQSGRNLQDIAGVFWPQSCASLPLVLFLFYDMTDISIGQHHYTVNYLLCSAVFKYWSHSNTATLKRALEIKWTIFSVFQKGKLGHSNAPAWHIKWQNLNSVPGCVAPTSILLTPWSSAFQVSCCSSFQASCAGHCMEQGCSKYSFENDFLISLLYSSQLGV